MDTLHYTIHNTHYRKTQIQEVWVVVHDKVVQWLIAPTHNVV